MWPLSIAPQNRHQSPWHVQSQTTSLRNTARPRPPRLLRASPHAQSDGSLRPARQGPCMLQRLDPTRRQNHPRTDGVDTNAPFGIFQCRRLREPNDAMFAGNVGHASRADQVTHGRHVHDGAAAALVQHLANLILHTQPDALEIDVD